MTNVDIPPFLDRRQPKASKPLVYTYTILNAYKNVCPHQMFRRYIKKDLGPYVQSPEAKWGQDVHTAFEHRVGAAKPLPDNMRQWEPFAAPFDGRNAVCEQKIGITSKAKPAGYWDADCWFRGQVDVALIDGENAYINDFKTGKSNYEDPFELECGAILLKVQNPQIKKVMGAYTWLKENRLGRRYDLSDFRGTWNKMNSIIEQIEQDKARNEFDKKQSGLCSWCAVKDCENWRERK